jgi:lipoprotein-anchoring transpeptidase ErfK/SrfK
MWNLYQPYRIRLTNRRRIAPVTRAVEKAITEVAMPRPTKPRRPSRRRRMAGLAGGVALALTAVGAARPAPEPASVAGAPILLDPIVVTLHRPVVLDPIVVTVARSGPSAEATAAASHAVDAPDADRMRIVVNLPAYRLDVYRGDSLVRTFPVTIGAPGYETPTGSYEIDDIIFNPWWHPPTSDWAIGKSPVAPGPENPMGRAKLNFAPLLYLHGSANEATLGTAASHGCVRLANDDIIELARIVQSYGAPGAASIVDPLVADPARTHQIDLDRRVRLEIRYDVAEVYRGKLQVHEDVYGLRNGGIPAEIRAALTRAGDSPARSATGSLIAS